jgi:hypothetical protein
LIEKFLSEGGHTVGDRERLPSSFLKDNISALQVTYEAFFGHVRLVEGIVLPSFVGCWAVVGLRDTPGKEVGLITTEQRLQSLLETALATGNLLEFGGHQDARLPWASGAVADIDVYKITGVTLYSFK